MRVRRLSCRTFARIMSHLRLHVQLGAGQRSHCVSNAIGYNSDLRPKRSTARLMPDIVERG